MHLNSIDVIHEPIQAHTSSQWENKDLSKVQFGSVVGIEKNMDWTFQSAYKGTISSLSETLPTLPAEITMPASLTEALNSGLPDGAHFAASLRRD